MPRMRSGDRRCGLEAIVPLLKEIRFVCAMKQATNFLLADTRVEGENGDVQCDTCFQRIRSVFSDGLT